MDQKPSWSFERSHRVVYAVSCVVVFTLLLIYDTSTGDKSKFMLGSLGYWVCTTPFIVVIALLGGGILTAVYAVISYILQVILGQQINRKDLDAALLVGGYLVLCVITFAVSKSTGQPDSQAFLAALFLSPVLVLLLNFLGVVGAVGWKILISLIKGIRILP